MSFFNKIMARLMRCYPAKPEQRLVNLFNGRSLFIDPNDTLGLSSGIFEPQETALCRDLIKPGSRVLDVGANIGYYTVLFAEWVGPSGHVIAVEPDPANLELLLANTEDFRRNGRVSVQSVALGDQEGKSRLYQSRGNIGMHRLYPSVCCQNEWVEVSVRKGDSLGLAPLDFIKIDIEGYEPYALRGLAATLRASPKLSILAEFSPLAMIEGGSSPVEFLHWMGNLGFLPLAYDGKEWCQGACVDLLEATRCIENSGIDRQTLLAEMRSVDIQTQFARLTSVVQSIGYHRPLVENLLFMRA